MHPPSAIRTAITGELAARGFQPSGMPRALETLTGTSRVVWWRWLKGERRLREDTIESAFRALGLEVVAIG